ncbi:MAG: methionine biosynthesis protein MetW [Anaerolineae bacterium]|jgi:methionine biosynthesis protein MetW|nr:methionine biosynthesis protein MetW [Chloroflexota bacterium]
MSDQAFPNSSKLRLDHQMMGELVPRGSRVLDLGCGDGDLLLELKDKRQCQVRGIEINPLHVQHCIERGLPVYHGDMLEGIQHYRDGSFDVVLLGQTLQQTEDPLRVIHEMLRVGERAIISFPNFGWWKTRLQLLFTGRMPRHRLLPYQWYNTPNVHLCTIKDFWALCQQEQFAVEQVLYLVPTARRVTPFLANWRAGLAIFELRRGDSARS